MIKFEYGMLVLDKNATKEDVTQIDAFAEYVRNQEQERIIKLLEAQAAVTGYVEIEFLKLYALIKGENK
jgi:hypothetical protein